jgi:hypothetical protein
MLELVPGVSRNVFRDNDPQSAAADAEYKALRPGALARHKHTCQFCSVESVEGMEVHHLDCNHANNSQDNLKPACVLCHPVNHLGEIAARFTRMDQSEIAGKYVSLSYLPDLSQQDLSHLLRTIGFVINEGTEPQKEEATALYEHLLSYSGYVEGAWGSSDASHFAIALRECSAPVYEARVIPMAGIKLVFSIEAVKKLAKKFMSEFRSLPIAAWEAISKQRYPTQPE